MSAAAVSVSSASDNRPSLNWRLVAPLALAYALFFLAPLALLAATSFYDDEAMTEFGLGQWRKLFTDPFYLNAVLDTMRLGVITVLATVVLAYPLAIVFALLSPRGKRILLFIIILPLLTSVVVRTFAWIAILAREGVINQTLQALGLTSEPIRLLQTEFGVVLALTQIEMPLMLLPLCTVLSRLDPRLIDASLALGASLWRTLIKVVIPLSLPGLVAGCLLVFASSVTAFITQSVIGGGRLMYLPALVWQQAMVVYNWPFAAVISMTLLSAVLIVAAALSAVGNHIERKVHG